MDGPFHGFLQIEPSRFGVDGGSLVLLQNRDHVEDSSEDESSVYITDQLLVLELADSGDVGVMRMVED